jgi:hypothetical protein
MLYLALSDTLLFLHFAFILFVVFGAGLVWRFPRLVWLHLPAVMWAVGVEISGATCPLTPLENRLRGLGGEAGYRGGFVEHYLLPIVYPQQLTHDVQIALGLAVALINAIGYALLYRRSRAHAD